MRDDAGAWAGEPFAEQGELPSIRVGSFHRNNLTRHDVVKVVRRKSRRGATGAPAVGVTLAGVSGAGWFDDLRARRAQRKRAYRHCTAIFEPQITQITQMPHRG